ALWQALIDIAKPTVAAQRQPARTGDLVRSVLDPARADRLLGWRPEIDLDRGLRHTWAWFSAGVASQRAAAVAACWPGAGPRRGRSPWPTRLTASVITPTKNRPVFLAEAIRALLVQTVLPDELIVVDQSDDDRGRQQVTALVDAVPAAHRPRLIYLLDRSVN